MAIFGYFWLFPVVQSKNPFLSKWRGKKVDIRKWYYFWKICIQSDQKMLIPKKHPIFLPKWEFLLSNPLVVWLFDLKVFLKQNVFSNVHTGKISTNLFANNWSFWLGNYYFCQTSLLWFLFCLLLNQTCSETIVHLPIFSICNFVSFLHR